MLGFEVFGDLDAKRVADDVGVRAPQPGLGIIDQGQVRADGCAGRRGGRQDLIGFGHSSNVSNNCANIGVVRCSVDEPGNCG